MRGTFCKHSSALDVRPPPSRSLADAWASPREARQVWFLIVPLTLACASDTTLSAQWTIQPAASVEARYEDDIRLTGEEDTESGYSTSLSAAVRALRRTEISDAGVRLGVDTTRYPSHSDLDNTSGYIDFDFGYQQERASYGLAASIRSESTLISEQAAVTGLNQVNQQRTDVSLTPSWTYLVSERTAVSALLAYTRVFYEDVAGVPLQDYQLATLTLTTSYRLSERSTLGVAADYGRYEAQDLADEYDNAGIQIGGDYAVSETLVVRGLIGARLTDQTQEGPNGETLTQESTGTTFGLGLAKQFETGRLGIHATQQLQPSGTGEVLNTTALRLSYHRQAGPRLSWSISGSASRNEGADGDDVTDVASHYATIEPRISYALDRDWRVALGYRYRWQDRDDDGSKAHSNALFLTLNWTRPWEL